MKPLKTASAIECVELKDLVCISQSRIQIRYGEDGGLEREGLIEIRRGVEDISLGNNLYAQIRIGVEGNLYLKGMAVYSDDLPDGVDVRVNTHHKLGTPIEDILEKIKPDSDIRNPFGVSVKSGTCIDKKQQSAINIVNKERGWKENEWINPRHLSTQFLFGMPHRA